MFRASSLGEEHLHVEVPVGDLLANSSAEVVQRSSNGICVGLAAVQLSLLHLSLVVDSLHVSEQSQQVLGLTVCDSPSRFAFTNELLRVEGSLLGVFKVIIISSRWIINRVSVVIELRFLNADDLLFREDFVLNLAFMDGLLLGVGEGHYSSYFSKLLLN